MKKTIAVLLAMLVLSMPNYQTTSVSHTDLYSKLNSSSDMVASKDLKSMLANGASPDNENSRRNTGNSLISGIGNTRPSYSNGFIQGLFPLSGTMRQGQGRIDSVVTGSTDKGLFGSVAIPFSGSKMEAKWKRTYKALKSEGKRLCSKYSCPSGAEKVLSEFHDRSETIGFFQKLEQANKTANHLISYHSDRVVYGKLDHWARPAQSVPNGRGDCEDYAILKHAMLKAAGVPEASMSIVILRDTRRELYHAVLAVSTNKGHFILDNVRDKITKDKYLTHYMPLLSFSQNRSWMHGWRTGRQVAKSVNKSSAIGSIAPGGSASGDIAEIEYQLSEQEREGLLPTPIAAY